jgi:hypothetical protein
MSAELVARDNLLAVEIAAIGDRPGDAPPKVRFATDASLQEDGFELRVPPWMGLHEAAMHRRIMAQLPEQCDEAALVPLGSRGLSPRLSSEASSFRH